MLLLVGLGHWLTEYACNQNMVQKYCASASMRDARRALWIGCAWMLPLWIGFQFLGTALWVFYQRFPTPTSEGILAGTVTAERIIPHFVATQLPVGLCGLVVAGVLAAAMSTLDSALNAIAAVGVVDVYRRHLVKQRDDAHYLRVAKVLSWLASAGMIVGALLLLEARTKTLEDAAIRLIALTSGGLLGLYLLGFLTRRGDGRSAALAIAGHAAVLALSRRVAAALVPRRPAHSGAGRRARVLHRVARARADVRRGLDRRPAAATAGREAALRRADGGGALESKRSVGDIPLAEDSGPADDTKRSDDGRSVSDCLRGRRRAVRSLRGGALPGPGRHGRGLRGPRPRAGRDVALKTIRPEVAGDARVLQRFKREIPLARRVTHPNVCRIFDLFHHPAPRPVRPIDDVPGHGDAARRDAGRAAPPRGAAAHRARRCRSSSRWRRRCRPLTRQGSSTATSSRAT